MFERLPGQNLNKIKQDNSFTFTWYREGVNCNVDSDLIHLVNKRARLTYPDLQDVFHNFSLRNMMTRIYIVPFELYQTYP